MKTTLRVDKGVEYEFSDEESYEGHQFISFKKVSSYKENKKYQNLTIKPEHWEQFVAWLSMEILESKAEPGATPKDDVPF